jgi:predicted  nucleic acid-binding Zn-ribbon protein
MGDDTKGRIADLASGWSVDSPGPDAAPEPAPEPAPPPTRKKHKTQPPPAPGSAQRKAMEKEIVDIQAEGSPKPAELPPLPSPRAKPPTAPPPIPPARTKPPTAPPPLPKAQAPHKTPNPFNHERVTSVVVEDVSLGAQKFKVPVGEFDSGVQTVEDSKTKLPEQATVKRDAAEALLHIGVGSLKPRGDEATAIDPAPTRGDREADATEIEPPSLRIVDRDHEKAGTGGKLRPYAALRRQRGLLGDVRYVSTALFGVRRSRRELVDLEQRQVVRQNSRRRHLVTLGRTAISADAFDHVALAEAREALANVEDERSKHAGAVAAADAELDRTRRDREAKTQTYANDVATVEAELTELGKKLEPLEKEAAGAKKRAAELRESLQKLAKKLDSTKALLVSVKSEKMDRAGIQAEIATLEADRIAVQRDEPTIAAELDALSPRIAAIEGARAEARKKRKDLDEAEAEDKRRTAELYEAIGSKRKVVERASAEAEQARDNALFELGERLYVDRPAILGAQLSPIDEIDLELGESDRRVMELREILSNIDKAKLARGMAMIILTAAALGGFVAWMVSMLA